MEKNEEKAREI